MSQIHIGKTYLTKNGRFVKITDQPWQGVFNGEYEEDGRKVESHIYGKFGRWLSDKRAWNFIFPGNEFYMPDCDIIMEDCDEARKIAEQMKLERKQKAYEETA